MYEVFFAFKYIADPPSRLCVGIENLSDKDRCPWEIATISGEPEELSVKNQTLSLKRLKEATSTDTVLKKVIKAVKAQDWETNSLLWMDKEVAKFKPIFDELYINDGKLVRTGRVIVPASLREDALRVSHTGNPGETAMKTILRARVWWPGMDSDISRHVQECKGCALTSRSNPPVPMSRSIMPAAVWDYIAMDFNGPYAQHGSVYVVTICDYFSRFMIATIVVKEVLECVFEKFGKPIGIRVDNGPPFNGAPFREYCELNSV